MPLPLSPPSLRQKYWIRQVKGVSTEGKPKAVVVNMVKVKLTIDGLNETKVGLFFPGIHHSLPRAQEVSISLY